MIFCMYTTLGQGQEMTLTFNTHISSHILPNFRSLAAIVSANYDGLMSPMLHTKFRGNPPAGSGEDF